MTNAWGLDSFPILRNARAQLIDLGPLEAQLADAAPDATTSSQASVETFHAAMSAGLQDVIDQYQTAHASLRFLRFVKTVDGRPQVVLDAGGSPPNEEELVHLTVAVSVADVDGLHVVAEVLFAARPAS